MCLLQNLWKEKFEVAFFVIPGDNEHLFFCLYSCLVKVIALDFQCSRTKV